MKCFGQEIAMTSSHDERRLVCVSHPDGTDFEVMKG